MDVPCKGQEAERAILKNLLLAESSQFLEESTTLAVRRTAEQILDV